MDNQDKTTHMEGKTIPPGQRSELEFAAECYSVGFVTAAKCLLERINDQQTYDRNSIYPFIKLANNLPSIMETGFFVFENGSIKFIPNRKPVNDRPLLNLAHFDFVCNSCGHEFWKQELKRYPEKEGDLIQCPHCLSDKTTQL